MILILIQIVLFFLNFFLYKNSRTYLKEPILRVWHIIILGIVSLIPIVGILTNIVLFIFWFAAIICDDFAWKDTENKFWKFLNKKIK